MCFGLPGGVAISIELVAKFVGFVAASPICPIVFADAEAKTSARSPCWVWVARSELAPKLNVIVAPGCMALNRSAIAVKVSVRDDAASTVIDPDTERAAAADPDVVSLDPPDEHAETRNAVATTAASVFVMQSPPALRPR